MEIIVILHNIRSLQNVGSIFRTADAAGVKKIYLAGITPAPVDVFGKPRQQLTKVSLGAEKYVSWQKIKSVGKLIDDLKNPPAGGGYKIFAIEQNRRAVPYHRVSSIKYKVLRKNKIVLVVGSEIKGLPKSILEKSDKILEIPMAGKKESLNVSVAFGIVVFHILNCYNPVRN